MNVADLIAWYPTIYHMAEVDAWPSIQRHGLLPTRTLVEMFELDQAVRARLLTTVRSESTVLHHPTLGSVKIRDQKPAKFLHDCIDETSTPQQFLDALNDRVYFWATEERLHRLLNATQYRHQANIVLHIDTAALIDLCGDRVELAPYNTGSMHVPNAPKRGHTVFTPIADYPYDEWKRKRGRQEEPLVEITVRGGLSDIKSVVRRIETHQPATQ